MDREEKVTQQWVAVLRYDHETKKPIFHTNGPDNGKWIVNASDIVGAMTRLDLMDVFYTDVMRYVDNDQLYLFDESNS